MAYIRVKKVKGIDYFYLVKSKWDSKRKTSIQHTIKYLGKASEVRAEDIPLEHRNNPRILSIINSNTKNEYDKNLIDEELKNQIFENLKNGQVEDIFKIAKKFKENSNLSAFYDNILRQIFYRIGSLWEQNKLDIGTEHVCSNIAIQVISNINKLVAHNTRKETIILCTPEGEMHNIGINMIESILLEKGYRVYNISPSLPAESVLEFVKEKTPSIIMISVTLYDNINSAKRLVRKIRTNFKCPILLGGLALRELEQNEINNIEKLDPNIKIITSTHLDSLLKIIRESTNNNKSMLMENTSYDIIHV